MRVVDTNIIFHYLIRGALTKKVETLHGLDSLWYTEPFALIELSNVLATYERAGHLTLREALGCMTEAEALLSSCFVTVFHSAVIELAIRYRVTAYDARFLVVAETLGQKLVTEDRKLRAAAPNLTQSVEEALVSV